MKALLYFSIYVCMSTSCISKLVSPKQYPFLYSHGRSYIKEERDSEEQAIKPKINTSKKNQDIPKIEVPKTIDNSEDQNKIFKKEVVSKSIQTDPIIEPIEEGIEDPIDINKLSIGGTLLYRAVCEDDIQEAKRLLTLGANPNIGYKSFSPLLEAVRNRNKEMVSLLLSHGAEIVFNYDGSSDLLRFVEFDKNEEILSIILCHFASEGKQDSEGLSPIHWSCRDGYLNVVKYLLEKDPSLIYNTDNPYHFTPLHWASRRGFKEIVELLISKGPSKTAISKSRFTPLMLAITNGHEHLREILSSDGSSGYETSVDRDWLCSICLSGVDDYEEEICVLVPLDCGHKFHLKCIINCVESKFNDENNNESIHPACPYCRKELAYDMLMFLHGYCYNTNDYDFKSIKNNLCDLVKSMVVGKINIDVGKQILIDLIRQGVKVNIQNSSLYTPIHYLYHADNDGYKSILKEAGGIRSDSIADIQPAFGLSGDAIMQQILYGRVLFGQ